MTDAPSGVYDGVFVSLVKQPSPLHTVAYVAVAVTACCVTVAIVLIIVFRRYRKEQPHDVRQFSNEIIKYVQIEQS